MPPTTSPSSKPSSRVVDKPADLAERIAEFEAFEGVEAASVAWLVAKSEYCLHPAHSTITAPGEAVDTMQVIVEGRYKILLERDGSERDLGEQGTGFVTGVLPFSRMTHATGTLRCLEDTYVLHLHRGCFTDLVGVSYRLVQNLVAMMSNRIREFADIRSQDEKMMSLGKLSAGLAHELNNPSAAIVRSAEELYEELHNTPESFKGIMLMQVSPDEVDAINELLFARVANIGQPDDRTALDRMEDAEAIEDWLDDHDLGGNDELVESFTEARFSARDLDRVHEIVGGRSMEPLLAWLAKNITLEGLVAEIRESAGRISELVGSVKSYTHMDRDGGRQCIDVHEGLTSTLTMLKHRFKQKGVQLVKEFGADVPSVMAWGGQINQVYTNLIDNAIDAAGDGGTVTVRTTAQPDGVCIAVEDTGAGVPDELREKIFDPFFTTKDVGEGTGMGLDITKKILARHRAEIELDSEPGRTVFSFCLPLAPSA